MLHRNTYFPFMLCGILFFLSVIVATASVIGCTVVLRYVLDNAGHFVSELMPLYAICSTIVILTVCTIIDNLRITLLEKPLFKFLYNKISGFIEKVKDFGDRFFRKMNIE